MASNSERIKEKIRKFQISYMGRTMKLRIPQPPHSPIAELSLLLEVVMISSAWRVQPYTWGQGSSRKQSRCGRHGLSNILKLHSTFLYSIYHQRAGKTNLFHTRGGLFHAGNTLCTFKCVVREAEQLSVGVWVRRTR